MKFRLFDDKSVREINDAEAFINNETESDVRTPYLLVYRFYSSSTSSISITNRGTVPNSASYMSFVEDQELYNNRCNECDCVY